MSKKPNAKLNIQIHSPEETIWQGEADAVSSTNSLGEFDILPEHANFITIVENKPILIHQGKEALTFNFYYSVIHSEKDRVRIFAHI